MCWGWEGQWHGRHWDRSAGLNGVPWVGEVVPLGVAGEVAACKRWAWWMGLTFTGVGVEREGEGHGR
ncbi:hypothetical protein GCM10008938_37840 [Deinococcus roseus]|uniref:Uncharacterized protein n=1 Tax=Deinococcus roseus TaxID=392414 RepID=A0ABQ2D817_9DEIO|nr:hypothetical protein GCM10008938_37840 [Deinococcus roseus]